MLLLGLIATIFFNDANAATVFPIATNTSFELSGGIAANGSNYLVGFLSGTNICVQPVSTNGSLLGPAVTIGASQGNPHLAASDTNCLVIWFDDFTSIDYGQIISQSGSPAGTPFVIASGNPISAVASDGTNYLVVLRGNGENNLLGQIITSTGTLSGSSFSIGNQTEKYAAVVFGKTNYLVVSKACLGVFVSPGGVAGNTFQINQTSSAANNFHGAAFDGTNFLAMWMWNPGPDTGGSLTNWSIYGRLVSPTGTFPGNEVQLVTDPGNNVLPSAAFDGSSYLLTWGYGFQAITNTNIRFQFLNRSANAIGPQFTLFTAQGTNAPLLAIKGLIFDGARFAMAATLGKADFSSADVYGGFIPSSTALPQLNTPSFTSGQFSLTLTGTPGINYAIQTSTNLSLANWTGLVTNSPTNGTFNFTDSAATNDKRFYRAVKQ